MLNIWVQRIKDVYKRQVQGHTETLWKLLDKYNVPTFIFVNKMDMPNVSGDFLLHELKDKFGDEVVRFPAGVGTYEDIAMCNDDLFEQYMNCLLYTSRCV